MLRRLQEAASARIDDFSAAMVEEHRGVIQFARPLLPEIDIAGDVRSMPEVAEILSEALGRPVAFAQTPIEQVRQYSKEMALMFEWFDRVGYSADIAGLEREFGRALTKFPNWTRRHAPVIA